MIRCPTIDREMPVKRCLEYQEPRIGEDSWNKGEPTVYRCCTGCLTGELLRLGKKDEAIQSTEKEEMMKEKTADETAVKEARQPKEKQCKKCKKVKPLEEFCRDKKARDGHRNLCLKCNRAYQNDWTGGKRKKAATAEEQEMLHNVKLIEDHAEAARQRMEEQVEPTPAKEITAPACPRNEDEILQADHGQDARATGNQLTLDFSCYPEVLKEIKRIAHREERPPEVQARFMLKRLLQDGWNGEARDACGRCPVPLPYCEPMFFEPGSVFPCEDGGCTPRVRDLEQGGANG